MRELAAKGDGNVLYHGYGVITHLYTSVKTHPTIPLKLVNFIIYTLYFSNKAD